MKKAVFAVLYKAQPEADIVKSILTRASLDDRSVLLEAAPENI
jgi:hypothetical protein